MGEISGELGVGRGELSGTALRLRNISKVENMMLGEQRFRLKNAPQLMKAAFVGARSQ